MPLTLAFQQAEEQTHFHTLLNLATFILLFLFSAWKFPLFMSALKVLVGLGPGKHRQADKKMMFSL